MSITFVRHGQTEWNRLGLVQGVSDIPLNDTGREQAREAGKFLAEDPVEWTLITSSPLSRARETAEIIAERLGYPVGEPVDDLREQNYGVAEGVTMEEFNTRWPDRQFEEGESSEELTTRGLSVLNYLDQMHPDGNVLAVSHGALIRRLISVITGIEYHDVPSIINSALTQFEKDSAGNWQVTWINNMPASQLLAQEAPAQLVSLGDGDSVCTAEGVCS